jgi:hypothetical protein
MHVYIGLSQKAKRKIYFIIPQLHVSPKLELYYPCPDSDNLQDFTFEKY